MQKVRNSHFYIPVFSECTIVHWTLRLDLFKPILYTKIMRYWNIFSFAERSGFLDENYSLILTTLLVCHSLLLRCLLKSLAHLFYICNLSIRNHSYKFSPDLSFIDITKRSPQRIACSPPRCNGAGCYLDYSTTCPSCRCNGRGGNGGGGRNGVQCSPPNCRRGCFVDYSGICPRCRCGNGVVLVFECSMWFSFKKIELVFAGSLYIVKFHSGKKSVNTFLIRRNSYRLFTISEISCQAFYNLCKIV